MEESSSGTRRALLGLGGASAVAALTALATAGEAGADEAFNQQIASALGFWPVLQDDPPTATTRYGVPVVWISRRATLVDTPTLPIVPSFDNAQSRYTIPASVGIDYYVGATLKPPGTYTSGPRTTVTITAVARDGYIIPGAYQWRWSFPDPTEITVVTSDGFSDADAATVVGRTTDLVSGGTAAVWKVYQGDSAAWAVTGGRLRYTGAAGTVALPGGSGSNFRMEWEISRYENVPHMTLIMNVAALATTFGGLYIGGAIDATRIYTGGGQIVGTAPRLTVGRYALQYFDRTAILEMPSGTRTFDLTAYNASDQGKFGSTATIRSQYANSAVIEIDNIVLKKVGW